MEAIRKAFPSSVISESVIRKVLKTCADFKREGVSPSEGGLADMFTVVYAQGMKLAGGC